MLALAREHDAEQKMLERDAEARRRGGVTVRELAREYLGWLEDVKGASRPPFEITGASLPSRVSRTVAAVAPLAVW
jgi:hypothetical protein